MTDEKKEATPKACEALDEADVYAAALEKAIALAEEGWSYASEYFREKWGCAEQIAELRRIAGVTDSEPLPTSWAEHVLEKEEAALRTGEEPR